MADALRIEVGAPADPDHSGGATFTSFQINQTTDKIGFVCQAPEAATITRLGFRYGAKSSGTPPRYRISLQGVGTDGLANGTIKGATNSCSAVFLPPADTSWDGTWQWVNTTESYTVARGEWIAVVIEDDPGTADTISSVASGSFSHSLNFGGGRTRHPFAYTIDSGGAAVRQALTALVGFGSSSVAYGRPAQTITQQTFSSSNSPNEYGMRFTLPAGWGDTFQLLGLKWFGHPASVASKSATITLYNDSDPTVGANKLQQVVYDLDANQSASSSTGCMTIYFDESTLATLTYGSTYHVAITANETGVGISLMTLDLAAAADRAPWPGGESFHLVARVYDTDTSWTTVTTTKRPVMHLILADSTEPAGGGAGGNADILHGSVVA